MTVALCTNCGSLKFGALLPCGDCDSPPTGESRLDTAFTDHYLAEETLRAFGRVIQLLRRNTDDEGIAFWAFLKHISDQYPEILVAKIPQEFARASSSLLVRTRLPEVLIEDSPRLDALEDETDEMMCLSRVRHSRIECEACGNLQSFARWSRMNGSVDHWLVEMILSGRVFLSRCRNCGHQQAFPFETQFINLAKKFGVWLRAPICQPEFRIEVPQPESLRQFAGPFSLRMATSPFEFIEKVRCNCDGYDDILVELVKLSVCFQREFDLSAPLFYSGSKRTFWRGELLRFTLFNSPEQHEEIEYVLGRQKGKLLKIIERLQPAICSDKGSWLHIDRRFVLDQLEAAGMLNAYRFSGPARRRGSFVTPSVPGDI